MSDRTVSMVMSVDRTPLRRWRISGLNAHRERVEVCGWGKERTFHRWLARAR